MRVSSLDNRRREARSFVDPSPVRVPSRRARVDSPLVRADDPAGASRYTRVGFQTAPSEALDDNGSHYSLRPT